MALAHRRSVAPAGGIAARRPRVVSVQAQAKMRSKVGFRYNPAQLRWERDDRFADLSVDDSKTIIKPKTGEAYQAWPVVHTVLTDAGLKSVSCEEASKLARSGWTIVDVRLAGDFDRAHAAGSVNVPMYRFVEGQSVWDNLKRLAMASFAMKATERNPNFVKDLEAAVGGKNKKVLMVCAIGGTLDTLVSYRREKRLFNDPERAFGRESRSLKAAYELIEAGWSANNIRHVEGGFQQWRYQGFPVEPEAEEK